jgi:hypothetical protein
MFEMLIFLLDASILFRLLSPHFFEILSRWGAVSFLFYIELILIMTWLNQVLFS